MRAFDSQREPGLAQLSRQRALVRKEYVLHELLGDRAAALAHAPRAQVRDQRAREPAQVDAVVLAKAAILDHEDRIQQMLRKLTEPDRDPIFRRVVGERADRLGIEPCLAELPAPLGG